MAECRRWFTLQPNQFLCFTRHEDRGLGYPSQPKGMSTKTCSVITISCMWQVCWPTRSPPWRTVNAPSDDSLDKNYLAAYPDRLLGHLFPGRAFRILEKHNPHCVCLYAKSHPNIRAIVNTHAPTNALFPDSFPSSTAKISFQQRWVTHLMVVILDPKAPTHAKYPPTIPFFPPYHPPPPHPCTHPRIHPPIALWTIPSNKQQSGGEKKTQSKIR